MDHKWPLGITLGPFEVLTHVFSHRFVAGFGQLDTRYV